MAVQPEAAARLGIRRGGIEDPHAARLVEAFAYLTARIRAKLDDEFPELTDSFLNVLYPHYLAPVPPAAIVQFVLDRSQGELTTGYKIGKGAGVEISDPGRIACRFRTCYDTRGLAHRNRQLPIAATAVCRAKRGAGPRRPGRAGRGHSLSFPPAVTFGSFSGHGIVAVLSLRREPPRHAAVRDPPEPLHANCAWPRRRATVPPAPCRPTSFGRSASIPPRACCLTMRGRFPVMGC